jgi:hypothetical protein
VPGWNIWQRFRKPGRKRPARQIPPGFARLTHSQYNHTVRDLWATRPGQQTSFPEKILFMDSQQAEGSPHRRSWLRPARAAERCRAGVSRR